MTHPRLIALATALFGCSIATAGDMGPVSSSIFNAIKPVVSLQTGYASINAAGRTLRIIGTDADVFTYLPSSTGQNASFVSVFVGAEHAVPFIKHTNVFMNTGVEYNYFGKVGSKGINTVGVEPQTSTLYNYNYNFQAQQVVGTFKLFTKVYDRFLPYGEVGLGGSFNQSGPYHAYTTETGSINLTPGFSNNTQTQFSYNLGVGLDTEVREHIRVGLG
ncbi:MAG: hypothetical protein B7X00_01420, partial [Legionella sp. 21-45-4]